MIKKAIRAVSFSQWGIFVIAVILLIVASNIKWGKKEYWKNTIASDGKGYYAYLPAIFIYQDLNFGFFESLDRTKYYDEQTFYDYRLPHHGKTINKYYVGTAVAQLPFFAVGHIATKVTGGDADGYSKWYQISIGCAGIFWLLVGLMYLDKILLLYDIYPRQRLLVLLAAVFGTNAFYYSMIEPSMSHIYSFAFVSIFLYFSKKYFENPSRSVAVKMSFVFGMIVLIRPINGLIILILPFISGDFFSFKNGVVTIFKKPVALLSCILIFGAIIFIQSIIYKFSVDKFWIYSYGEEGFDFTNPHMLEILFSYKKGLFLYTPILFISLFGLHFVWKKSKFETLTWVTFFLFITYVLSSWWMWYYGGSFSGRVYLEFLSLFMILLGILLRDMPPGLKKNVFIFVIFLLIVVCQIQTYQYRYYQIHWSDMTKEKYWDVFLRPDKI